MSPVVFGKYTLLPQNNDNCKKLIFFTNRAVNKKLYYARREREREKEKKIVSFKIN